VDDILDGLGISDGFIDGNTLGADDGSALGLIIDTVDGIEDELVLTCY